MIRQLIKFGIIGSLATTVHSLVAFSLIYYFQLSILAVNILGFISAVSISYVGNLIYVFQCRASRDNAMRFIFISGISFIVVVLCSLITQYYDVNKYIAVLIIVIILPLLNFIFHKYWTFSPIEKKDISKDYL